MFKKRFLIPVSIALSLLILLWIDKACYQNRVPFLCPIQLGRGEISIRNDSLGDGHFGAKRKNGRSHKGIDISAPVGTPVKAAMSGWAVPGEHPTGYGKFIKIFHPGNLVTVYAHLKKVNVKWITRVRQGDIVGAVGKTGNAGNKTMKSHLHFEVKKGNIAQDPAKYLK